MTEENIQIHVGKLLTAYGRSDIEWHHVPNGARVRWKTAVTNKQMGVKPGVADFMMLIDAQSHALELKTEIGVVSQAQLDWRETYERAGGRYHVAFGLQQAIRVLTEIGAFRANTPSLIVSAADASGVRRRPWEASADRAATRPHLTPSAGAQNSAVTSEGRAPA